jgi:hypothetical protein
MKYVAKLKSIFLLNTLGNNMAIPRPTQSRKLPNKIQVDLADHENSLADYDAYKLRCRLEGRRYRSIKTARDVVDLLEWATNSLISEEKDAKIVSTIGYMGAISLQAIKLAKAETNPEEQLSERLKLEQLKLNMTPEEMKALLASTNVNVQINILNKAADRPKMPDVELIPSQDYLRNRHNPGSLEAHKVPDIIQTTLRKAGQDAAGIGDAIDFFADTLESGEILEPELKLIPLKEETDEDEDT